jgi:hypothetical protein
MNAYYEELKTLARQVRAENGLSTPRVLRSDMRRIYKAYGIRIDLWPVAGVSLRSPGCHTQTKLAPKFRDNCPSWNQYGLAFAPASD